MHKLEGGRGVSTLVVKKLVVKKKVFYFDVFPNTLSK